MWLPGRRLVSLPRGGREREAQSQMTQSDWGPGITSAEKGRRLVGQEKPRGVLRTSLLLWWCVQVGRADPNKLFSFQLPREPRELTIQ